MACLPLILPLLPEMMELAAGSSARVGRGCPAPEEPVPAQPAAPWGGPANVPCAWRSLALSSFPRRNYMWLKINK